MNHVFQWLPLISLLLQATSTGLAVAREVRRARQVRNRRNEEE
ncbi:hypothetical protein [Actinomadura keratinilytica]|jgi:hypothetical protein|uniref:Uncharacterized protein n=1 Tax=Actinomadura keratinilytica TaxID=547461 RepID=A0ABP7YK84_9ACTN